MTQEQINNLKLGIAPINDKTVLTVESALTWVQDNTTLKFDLNNDEDLKALPASVKLFITKYTEVSAAPVGVNSQSIEGLSQSYNSNKNGVLWDLAEQFLSKWLKSSVSFVPAQKKWH